MSEHLHQAALFSWADAAGIPELRMLFAVPNGGWRGPHPATARRLKDEGVRPGVPDIYLDVPRGEWHGLRIELKIKGGRLSPAQVKWLEKYSEYGYRAVCCYGWEQAKDEIRSYLRIGEDIG